MFNNNTDLDMKDIRQLAREFARKQRQQSEEQRQRALAKIREIRARKPIETKELA